MLNNPLKPEARKILEIIPQTELEWTFRVQNDKSIRHGQFMQISLPKIGEAPISISGFANGYADFTIRKVGKVTDELFNLKKGDSLFIRGCYGNGWPVDNFKDKNIVIIAGGTGVSPVKSLINMFYGQSNYAKEIYLILGFRNSKSMLFKDELAAWKESKYFHTVYTLDHEDFVGCNRGLVTEYLKDIPFDSFKGQFECIVVGPPVMMGCTAAALVSKNVPEEKIWMSF